MKAEKKNQMCLVCCSILKTYTLDNLAAKLLHVYSVLGIKTQ